MIFSTYIRFLNISISLNNIKVLNIIFSRHELVKQVNKGRFSFIWKIKKCIWLLITGLISPKLSTYKDKKLQTHNIGIQNLHYQNEDPIFTKHKPLKKSDPIFSKSKSSDVTSILTGKKKDKIKHLKKSVSDFIFNHSLL